MNRIEAIQTRRSVRSFDSTPIREEDAQKVLSFAEKVENPYDIPIRWRLLDPAQEGLRSAVIAGSPLWIAGKMRRCEHAEEAFGYTFEKVVLYACSLGLGTTWMAGTFDRAAFEKAMALVEGEVMPCVSPLGYPAKKMALREVIMRRGTKADTRLDFSELFFDGGFDRPLTPEGAGGLRQALELVRPAPSAVNRQPWRAVLCGDRVHFYEKRSRGYVGADGWDTQRVDMGIALCHFAIGAEESGLTASLLLEDPGLKAPEDTYYIASYAVS